MSAPSKEQLDALRASLAHDLEDATAEKRVWAPEVDGHALKALLDGYESLSQRVETLEYDLRQLRRAVRRGGIDAD